MFKYQVTNAKPNTISIPLKNIEDELSEYDFLRINNNILINSKYTKPVENSTNIFVTTSNGIELNFSRRKWLKFKNSI